jgi:hypothetical protein
MSLINVLFLTGLQIAVFVLAIWLAVKLFNYLSE